MKVEYPSNFVDFDLRFWRYTVQDLARIGVPAIVAWQFFSMPGMAVGAVTGVLLAEVTVDGKKLDEYLLDFSRFQAGSSSLPAVEQVSDGAVLLDNDSALGLIRVSSVDLDLASDAEQEANRAALHELVKEVDYPVEIHSRQRTRDLSGFAGSKEETVVTDHFVVVRTYQDGGTLQEYLDRLDDRCNTVRSWLTGADLYAERLTGEVLEDAVNELNFQVRTRTRNHYTVDNQKQSYRCLVYVSDYPESLPIGWLADILNTDAPGFVDTVQSIEPVSEKQLNRISRTVGRLKAEIASTNDPWYYEELVRKREDAESLLNLLATGEEVLVNYGTYVVAKGNTREEVDATVDSIKNVLRSKGIEHQEPLLRTHRAAKTDSILYQDSLQKTLIVPGRSAASAFSFSTQDLIEPKGVVFGEDTRNGSPVILDRFSWEAGHVVRMGKIGSGKSFSAKLSLLRALKQDPELQVRVIDPKQEYGVIREVVGGREVVLDDVDLPRLEVDSRFVRYTVRDRSRDNTELLTDAIRHIYRNVSQDQEKTIVLVDEAHRLLRNPDARSALGQLVREGRDRNVSVELVTQNASDFTRSQEGRDILKQVNCFMFMRHQDVDSSVTDFFGLSRREEVQLRKLRTGTDLSFSEAIIRGPVNTRLRIHATEEEHRVIENKPCEKTQENSSTVDGSQNDGSEVKPEIRSVAEDIENQSDTEDSEDLSDVVMGLAIVSGMSIFAGKILEFGFSELLQIDLPIFLTVPVCFVVILLMFSVIGEVEDS